MHIHVAPNSGSLHIVGELLIRGVSEQRGSVNRGTAKKQQMFLPYCQNFLVVPPLSEREVYKHAVLVPACVRGCAVLVPTCVRGGVFFFVGELCSSRSEE